MGAAFHDPSKRTIFLIEDTVETPHFDFINMGAMQLYSPSASNCPNLWDLNEVLDQVKADLILVPSRADEWFIYRCREYSEPRLSAR